MKKNLTTLTTALFSMAALLSAASTGYAAQIVGVYYTFDDGDLSGSPYPTDINTLADAPGNSGSASLTGSVVTGSLQDFANNDYGTFTAFDGSTWTNEDTATWQHSGGDILGAQMQIVLDLRGVTDVSSDFTLTLRNVANTEYDSQDITLEYSTDGTSFSTFGTKTLPTSTDAADLYSWDLSSVSAIEDTNNVTLRWSFPDVTTESNPNFRLDNFQVSATVIPEPSAGLLVLFSAAAFFTRRRRK
jgi:hypothetical protein